MSCLHRLIAFTALYTVCLAVPAAEAAGDGWTPTPYQLGQGLRFPDQGLDVGGYLSLQYESLRDQESALSVQDLSLFVSKQIDTRWNLFAEMEIGDALQVSEDGQVGHNQEFDIERLYAEYRVGPAVTLRFGKFLTPVGRWNLIHADPLVWTVSRPLTATAAFARHSIGAMVYGTVPAAGHDLDYWAFVDDTAGLDPLQGEETAFEIAGSSLTVSNSFNHAFGGRLLYHFLDNRLSLGASYLYFEMQDPQQDKNLVGLGFYWDSRYVELSGEAVYRTNGDWSASDEHGGFLQAVLPLPRQVYLVGRHERYSTDVLGADPSLNTLGITYRPRPPISLKLEYRSGANNELVAPDGWLASLAILF